jgi:2-polyprenyl-3-methyl-5-hydroxy-6-metoxy-1,4-benzoquinol methylase
MTRLDRFLRDYRVRKIIPYIPQGARVLDVGCHDGALFQILKGRIAEGTGVDPHAEPQPGLDHVTFITGLFPQDLPGDVVFDVITMLAVLEHFPPAELQRLPEAIAARLKPGGRFIATVPSPWVDHIIHGLAFLRLIHGARLGMDEHHGYAVENTTPLFTARAPLRLLVHQRFQWGLNNLFVFEKTS